MPYDITDQEPAEHLWMGRYRPGTVSVEVPRPAVRVVDLTDMCDISAQRGEQVVAKFANDFRGLAVEIQIRRPHGCDTSSGAIFYPDEVGLEGVITSDPFIYHAQRVGCEVTRLAHNLLDFAPSNHRTAL